MATRPVYGSQTTPQRLRRHVAVDYGDGVVGAPPPLRAHDGATTGDRIYG
ncbi:hypothetical protein [Haloferax elongans]|nr:hypothetical protein [Haloferax elongans]